MIQRDFEFRAYSITEAKLFFVFGFNSGLVFEQIFEKDRIKENVYERENCFIDQYIGVTDKTGRKIFENDIILWEGKKGVVVWEDVRFCIRFEEHEIPQNIPSYYLKKSEIIGTVYENKDLLSLIG